MIYEMARIERTPGSEAAFERAVAEAMPATVSGAVQAESGSLYELSDGGRVPVQLTNGERRFFLEDGDEVSLAGRCEHAGFAPIGFGACVGRITSTGDTAWRPG